MTPTIISCRMLEKLKSRRIGKTVLITNLYSLNFRFVTEKTFVQFDYLEESYIITGNIDKKIGFDFA